MHHHSGLFFGVFMFERPVAAIAIAFVLFSSSACSFGVCTSSCEKVYQEDQCGIQRPGQSRDELIRNCEDRCVEASRNGGDAGDYNPNEKSNPGYFPQLENRAQVVLWAECVETTACENLEDGYCAPLW